MPRFLILIFCVLISGCHWRGALEFDCARLDSTGDGSSPFRRPLPPSPLQQAIQDGTQDSSQAAELALAQAAEQADLRSFADEAAPALAPNAVPDFRALLLSGGGQWGAFGAGFMSRLLERGMYRSPNLVTGVSTGALQALFVGAGLDRPARIAPRDWASRGVTPQTPPTYADLMRYEYRPNVESEIVHRHKAMELAGLTGSMAGLRPLRRVIETALCADPDDPAPCMIDDLRASPIRVWIGFIDAEDGRFYYVDARQIAADTSLTRRERQQCITAAALASVAMPGFFQQVRINRHTYYDGGVRHSVFIDHAARHGQRAIQATHQRALQLNEPMASAVPPAVLPASQVDENLHLFVFRNGPTDLRPESGADSVTSVLDAALRAEQIVVNQLEVGSVAALRLEHPEGPLWFRSADGWRPIVLQDELGALTCEARKGEGVMFDPDFMRCIMAYGHQVGSGEPWRPLPGLAALTRLGAED